MIKLTPKNFFYLNRLAINQTRNYANESLNKSELINNQNIDFNNDLGHFDIVINGGGIVGLTFLLNLQKNSILNKKRILLIEQQTKPTINKLDLNNRLLSNRVSSLTEASKKFFEKLNIWPELDLYAKRIKEMQIWSSDLNKAISFDTFDLENNLKNVAYILENNLMLNSLNSNLNHDQILYSTNVNEIKEINNQINLFTTSKCKTINSKLTCNLLIGCDGFNSLVREKSNLNYFNLPLNQNGVVGTVKMANLEEINNLDNSISYQRFLPNRTVIAILPLTNEESSFVISTDKEFSKKLVEMNDEEFVKQFNQLLECDVKLPSLIKNFDQLIKQTLPSNLIKSTKKRLLPKINSVQQKSRAAFPLGFGTTLPNLVGSIGKSSNTNLALIGDAAHRVHPLAGQGLNLGIGDAIVLSDCLERSVERGEELFSRTDCPLSKERLKNTLNEFERERQLKLIAMLSTVHSMQDLFYYTPPVLLNAFDHMNWIKKQMIVYANSV